MNARRIQRLRPAPDPQKSRRLLKGFRPQPRHFQQVFPRLERPIGIAVRHNRLRQTGPQARNPGQQRRRGGVQLDPDRVDRILDHLTKATPQTALIHIMLILPDPNRLGFDLHQLRQRVLQAPRNADSAAQRHVHIGKLLRRQSTCRVNRGPRLADDHLGGLFARQNRQQFRHQLFGFPAAGAIADRDQLDPMRPDQPRQTHLRLPHFVLGRKRIDHVGRQNFAGRIDHRHLDPGPDPRIQAHRRLATGRRRQQQVLQIARKNPDRLGLRPFPHLADQVQREAGPQLDPPRPSRSFTEPSIAQTTPAAAHNRATGPLRRAFALRSIWVHLYVQRQEALVLPAQHRQDPMRRCRRPSLCMRKVIREFCPRRFLSGHPFGHQPRHLLHMAPQAPQQVSILRQPFGQNIPRALQRHLGIRHAVFDKPRSQTQRVRRAIRQNPVQQNLQPQLPRNHRLGPPLWLVGQIQILQRRLGHRPANRLDQSLGHLALLGDRG